MEILLVEDHLPTAQSISWTLHPKHQVVHAMSCHDAETQLRRQHFDILIVDLNLPDGSGFSFCQLPDDVRSPKVIVLSGLNELQTKVRALEAGADDYLTKPFAPSELQARVSAVLRRGERERDCTGFTLQQIGDFALSLQSAVVAHNGRRIQLTPTEQHIFSFLIRHRDQVVRKASLLEHVFDRRDNCANLDTSSSRDEGKSITLNTIETHIKTLRRKLQLGKKDLLIETIYGLGYRLNSAYAKL